MYKKFRFRFADSCSDNRKSKIENPKWLGLFVTFFLLSVCAAMAEAQQPTKVPRVGYLIPAAGISAQYEAFRQGLRDLGYTEGQNIAIEYRSGEGSSRLADLAAELAQLKVDVIVAQGGAAAPAKTAA